MVCEIADAASGPCPALLSWTASPGDLRLDGETLHVWQWKNAAADSDCSALAQDERKRAARMGNPRIRSQYLQDRLRTRRILGAYLGIPPGQVLIWTGPRGKPLTAAVAFNLTHSGTLSLLAVARDVNLGIDMEQVKPRRDLVRVAARMLGRHSALLLESLPAPERLTAFYRLWTRLEAGVKATGNGLFRGGLEDLAGLHCACFVPADGYIACLAMDRPCPDPRGWKAFRDLS
jgi:4'-phosphopantetheinyl transferase